MADEHEILKYQLDITDVEAKAQRILELQQQIATARGQGAQTTELEAQLNKEIESLGKLGQEEKKAVSITEELTREKGKLGQAVQLVGGNFGGAVGQIGSVVDLLASASPHTKALGIALAGLSIGVGTLKQLKDAANEAAVAQERLNQAVTDGKRERLTTLEQVELDLGKHGLRNAEGTQAAKSMLFRLQRDYGYQEDEAAGVTAQAVAEGLSPQEASNLIQLQGMGYATEGPGGGRRVLESATPAEIAEAQGRAGGIKTTEGGTHVIGRARGYTGRTPVERVQEALQEQGEEIGIGELRKRIDFAKDLEATIDKLNERAAAASTEPLYGGAGTPRMLVESQLQARREQMSKHIRYLNLYRREEEFGVVSGPPSQGLTPEQTEAQQQTAQNVTVYNDNRTVAGSITNVGLLKKKPNWNAASLDGSHRNNLPR